MTVEVTALDGISDPEAATIERSLPLLGFDQVNRLRVGRVFRFEVEAPDVEAAKATSDDLCSRLLANPVIQKAAVSVAAAEVT